MGTLDRVCWFVAGCALTYVLAGGMERSGNTSAEYKIEYENKKTFILEKETGKRRQLHRGLQLGSIEERVEDIMLTPQEDLKDLQQAVGYARQRYHVD